MADNLEPAAAVHPDLAANRRERIIRAQRQPAARVHRDRREPGHGDLLLPGRARRLPLAVAASQERRNRIAAQPLEVAGREDIAVGIAGEIEDLRCEAVVSSEPGDGEARIPASLREWPGQRGGHAARHTCVRPGVRSIVGHVIAAGGERE